MDLDHLDRRGHPGRCRVVARMSVVGVDLGISKVALVFTDGTDILAETYASSSSSRADCLRELGQFANSLALFTQPSSIWIEDTLIGNNRKYSIQLAETKGAVMAALAIRHIPIELVNVATWKREIVGKGNADKTAVRNHIHDSYPAYAPHCGDDQDLFDASCVALYGLKVLDRARDLHL
jgi:Holliday junction resolvasome RuvABC endonuclease subunit